MTLFCGRKHAILELGNCLFEGCYHWLGVAGLFVVATQTVGQEVRFSMGPYAESWVVLEWIGKSLWHVRLFGKSFYL